jgi:hypothetical protein
MIERRRLSWRSWAAGVVCGAAAVALFGAAAPNDQQPTCRYQISTWSYAATPENGTSGDGAYRLDTQTGEVYAIEASGQPNKIRFP